MYCLHLSTVKVIHTVVLAMSSNQEIVREKILCTYQQNPDASHRWIAKKLGFPNSTVSRVIRTFKERLSARRKEGSGRKSGPMDKKMARKVVQQFKNRPNMSIRDVAKKCNVSVGFVQKTMKRAGLHVYKVQKAPNRNEKQNMTAKTRARKLYTKLLTKSCCLVMDDETYVKADFRQLPGQEYFVAKSKFDVPEDVRKKKVSKFAKKFLIWQAICGCGETSAPFITSGTMNGAIYTEECLKKRLLPFIRKHKGSTLFWPDLASCHYSRNVLEWYRANGVNFVPKDMNPPNSPELRPIEKFWAIMKTKLRKHPKIITTELELKKIWVNTTKTLGKSVVQNLMDGVKRKVRAFGMGEEIE